MTRPAWLKADSFEGGWEWPVNFTSAPSGRPAAVDQNASLGSRASNGSFRRNLSLAPLAPEIDSVRAMIGINGGIRPA